MAIGQTGEKSAAGAALLHISELKSPKNLGTVRPPGRNVAGVRRAFPGSPNRG